MIGVLGQENDRYQNHYALKVHMGLNAACVAVFAHRYVNIYNVLIKTYGHKNQPDDQMVVDDNINENVKMVSTCCPSLQDNCGS